MDQSNPQLAFVSLKAFGDFIIARWAIRRIEIIPHEGISMIIGDHLAELDTALGSFRNSYFIEHNERRVPALFDIKKIGISAGIQSAFRLRNLISKLNLPDGSILLFDKIGLRERFISSVYGYRSLPENKNIYLAYMQLLDFKFEVLIDRSANTHLKIHKTVGIFPGSRAPQRTLSETILGNLVSTCLTKGLQPTIFILDGENSNLPSVKENIEIIPRSFAAMSNAVCSKDLVISADSMPAHMSEYFQKPVFVVSPVSNEYWLPLSSFIKEFWGLFDENFGESPRLDSFLCPKIK